MCLLPSSPGLCREESSLPLPGGTWPNRAAAACGVSCTCGPPNPTFSTFSELVLHLPFCVPSPPILSSLLGWSLAQRPLIP